MTSECDMTAAGAKAVALWLARNPPLKRLRMCGEWHAPTHVDAEGADDSVRLYVSRYATGNYFVGDVGLVAVSEALKSNSTLAAVDVSGVWFAVNVECRLSP